uniref:Tyrosine specific protein phosphatases domain-containing protein n=1 Tax=Palpitomonas bilix TaxID=652834 RepID=A0A7S3D264_9EUKA|mmetsp:Transcript_16869/g.42345  ORF Transcript_16869/g.42345 Transcript_16869/m.42345 type:complete len:240 (-) Transcript_16869:95-814(-)
MKRASLLFFAVVVSFLVSAAADHEDYHPERTHLIDIVGKNFFFRGNNPLNATSFVYDEVVSDFKKMALKEGGVELPDDIYFVDISLLNIITERSDIEMEKNFFESNPTKGEFVNYPMVGQLVNPNSYPKSMMEYMAKHLDDWQIDRAPTRIDYIRSRLEQQGDRPVALYVHCEAGTDRTGELAGDYMLEYWPAPYNQNIEAVLDYADHIQSRDIEVYSKHGIEWYCNYLKFGKGVDIAC